MVRAEGLEPPHLSTTGPKPAASTNSATRADAVGGAAYNRRGRLGKAEDRQPHGGRGVRGIWRALNATARAQRAPYHPLAADASAFPAGPADRASAGDTDAQPRYRRALAALARDDSPARADLARRLGLQTGRGDDCLEIGQRRIVIMRSRSIEHDEVELPV